MTQLKGKKILLGITAGIAAYKIAYLIRSLKKSGAEVRCIMTPASCDFISPLVVSTLSGNKVAIEFWNKTDGTWNSHVEYGIWADVMVIAPLTANTLSKMATGGCDNLLLASYLSMKSRTIVAPAMDLDMYAHPTTQRNLKQLESDGVQIIDAEEGELASGLEGHGRMAEPETIVTFIEDYFADQVDPLLKGKRILITAGPTYEVIDPVRFIGNHSSGKMGFAIAEGLTKAGAHVILVCGPTKLSTDNPSIELHSVTTADEMLSKVKEHWLTQDAGIFAAAVADYRPKSTADEKIKKNNDELNLTLVRNPDILAWAGSNKSEKQVLAGFALETNDLLENGLKKLQSKNLDFIVLNSLKDDGSGFGVDTNKIAILDKHNNLKEFELKPKAKVALDIIEELKKYFS